MPCQITDLKKFLSICARKDARCVKIKHNKTESKFKVRCSRYLYTFVITDKTKAARVEQSIHPSVKKVIVTARTHAAAKTGPK